MTHIERLDEALAQGLRIVKPGGVILGSAACLLRLTSAEDDFWRLTAAGWRRKLSRAWPGCELEVQAHGNCLAAVAGLYGLALEELTRAELEVDDERFPLLTTMKCVKPMTARG
jgi:hypothetical protein